jgi:hypothetical protein
MIPRGHYIGKRLGHSPKEEAALHSVPGLRWLDRLSRSRPSVRARNSVASSGAGSIAITGAQFEIRIDGTPRTYRDRKDFAMEAARLIKSKQPHSMVESKT